MGKNGGCMLIAAQAPFEDGGPEQRGSSFAAFCGWQLSSLPACVRY